MLARESDPGVWSWTDMNPDIAPFNTGRSNSISEQVETQFFLLCPIQAVQSRSTDRAENESEAVIRNELIRVLRVVPQGQLRFIERTMYGNKRTGRTSQASGEQDIVFEVRKPVSPKRSEDGVAPGEARVYGKRCPSEAAVPNDPFTLSRTGTKSSVTASWIETLTHRQRMTYEPLGT
jgi:hypothetical protein